MKRTRFGRTTRCVSATAELPVTDQICSTFLEPAALGNFFNFSLPLFEWYILISLFCRSCVVAHPGNMIVACDYRFIELVTLSAVCKHRYSQNSLSLILQIRDQCSFWCYWRQLGSPFFHCCYVCEHALFQICQSSVIPWSWGNYAYHM